MFKNGDRIENLAISILHFDSFDISDFFYMGLT